MCTAGGGACRPGREETVEVIGRGLLASVNGAYTCAFSLPDGSTVDSTTATANERGTVVECTFPKAHTGLITEAAWDAKVTLHEFGRPIRFAGLESYGTVSYHVDGPVIGELNDLHLELSPDGPATDRRVSIPFTIAIL